MAKQNDNIQDAENPLTADPIPARVVTGLAKIGLAARHRAWTEGHGLTPTQGQILALLRTRPRSGMRLSEIAEAMGVSAASASVAVTTLERKGLLLKTRARYDGRAWAIALTDEGNREAERAAGWTDFLLAAVEVLSPTEQDAFYRGLVKMIVTLQERGEIPVSRMCVTCRFFRPNVHANPERPHHCALVDAPFGDRSLRLDCPEHTAAPVGQARSAVDQIMGRR